MNIQVSILRVSRLVFFRICKCLPYKQNLILKARIARELRGLRAQGAEAHTSRALKIEAAQAPQAAKAPRARAGAWAQALRASKTRRLSLELFGYFYLRISFEETHLDDRLFALGKFGYRFFQDDAVIGAFKIFVN